MNMSDYGTLSELHDLKGSRFVEYLEALRQIAIQKWTDSDDGRVAAIAQGEKRVLDRIIQDINTAWNKVQDERKKLERPNMSKAF